jgi:hemolysin III
MHKGEKLNSISHLVGTSFVIVGAAVLITLAGLTGDPLKIVSCSIYSLTLLLLYLFSTLYHSMRRGRAKEVLQKFDHCMIYLLIAGSYTPFTLVTLHGATGWTLFGIVWGLALIGVIQEFFTNPARIASLVIYVLMGWSVVFFIKPLTAALGMHGFYWLAAGGIIYSVGVIFYVIDERMKHAHGIWHMFVLGGSLCHFIAILFFVI